MRRTIFLAALLGVSMLLASATRAGLLSKTYEFRSDVFLEIGAATDDGLRVDSVRFQMPSATAVRTAAEATATVAITNTEKYPLTELTVSFYQAGYMDIATTADTITELGPGETREIDLYATFNKEVFSMVGATPLTGEIAVDYTLRTRGSPCDSRCQPNKR